MLAGSFLTPARRHKRPDERHLAVCRLCQQPDTEVHRYWHCPAGSVTKARFSTCCPSSPRVNSVAVWSPLTPGSPSV
eukprot:3508700-Amphidinium_carterae.1